MAKRSTPKRSTPKRRAGGPKAPLTQESVRSMKTPRITVFWAERVDKDGRTAMRVREFRAADGFVAYNLYTRLVTRGYDATMRVTHMVLAESFDPLTHGQEAQTA